jgi:hypothetical protein
VSISVSESYLFRVLHRAGLTATRQHCSTPQPGAAAHGVQAEHLKEVIGQQAGVWQGEGHDPFFPLSYSIAPPAPPVDSERNLRL